MQPHSPTPVAHLFPDLHPAFTPQEALVEANRCLFCYDAPCTAACPTHIDVPRFIKKIATSNLRGAAMTILDANLLGASCSRVCPVEVLCESACVMHRYNRRPIEIGRLQRRAMEHIPAELPSFPLPKRQLRVVCVGAGPASLSCAGELARRGHIVTVFEAKSLPGGLNTHGVAAYKISATDALREVQFIESLGVEIRCNEYIDAPRLEQLKSAYDAVFLGLGLGRMNPLGIEGEQLSGVVDALTFIAEYKTGQRTSAGRRVVVVGAGNTAIDAAVAAKRLGAGHVTILYRRNAVDMSAFAFEYEHAKHEGVEFRWQTTPCSLTGENGKIIAVECGNFALPCDLLIPAIGQSAVESLSGASVYQGGDLTNGGREVVDAVADGKRAALKIIGDLNA